MAMEKTKILIVEDNKLELEILKTDLSKSGFHCLSAEEGIEALQILQNEEVDVVLSDQRMPEMDGLELHREIKSRYGDIPFIMLTGVGTVGDAVISIKRGASDYILKPYNLRELLAVIERSINYFRLSEESLHRKKQLLGQYGFHNIITNSPAMTAALEKAKMVCSSSPKTTVSIYGESGTGKGMLARAIHMTNQTMEDKFVEINCSGIPSNLLESELFGHVKGAFTGADRDRDGKFDLAQKGTIFLDEIGDMPLELQAKLLRVLQERVYEKVGSNKLVKVDLRVVIATHRNLKDLVKSNRFREDLFYRINAFPITLPPLRERKEDIPLLVRYFLDHFRQEMGKPLQGVSSEAMDCLIKYHWPGNVRELKNCMERAAILTKDELIQKETLHLGGDSGTESATDSKIRVEADSVGNIEFSFKLKERDASLDTIMKEVADGVLGYCKNNKTRASEILKRNRSFFYRPK